MSPKARAAISAAQKALGEAETWREDKQS